MADVKTKRIYEDPSEDDGYRVLVDRLWPRGIKKQNVRIDEWNKEIAPSTQLRKWFAHRPELFEEFTKLYNQELEAKTKELDRLREIATSTNLTLLTAKKDPVANHARVLAKILSGK